jgi:RHS repeat-associated protein
VQDAATGLVYMQQRYYDAQIGRFLSVDPVAAREKGDNFNRYAYAFNNPYGFNDPTGREGEFILFRLVLAAASADAATPEPTDAAAPAKAAGYAGAIIGTAIGGGIMWAYNKATEGSEGSSSDASPTPSSQDAPAEGASTTEPTASTETITRPTLGADGGTSSHIIEKDEQGETISVTHQVKKDGETVHQHQTHIGKEGGRQQFPDEWVQYPEKK